MDLVHAKGASFYQSGAVTLMQAYTVTDVVGTQQRYQAAVADAADKYNSGEITLAQHDELVAQAEFERLYVPADNTDPEPEDIGQGESEASRRKGRSGIPDRYQLF